MENGAAGAPVAAGGATNAPDVVFADESAVYGEAFAAMKAGRYEEAARGFQTYLAKYPRGPRADNATYWLGEAQFVQQQYEAALKSFQAVRGVPRVAAAAGRMLKVGVEPVRAEGVPQRARHAAEADRDVPRDPTRPRRPGCSIDKLNAEGR